LKKKFYRILKKTFKIFEEKLLIFEPQNSNFENYDLVLVHAKTRHS